MAPQAQQDQEPRRGGVERRLVWNARSTRDEVDTWRSAPATVGTRLDQIAAVLGSVADRLPNVRRPRSHELAGRGPWPSAPSGTPGGREVPDRNALRTRIAPLAGGESTIRAARSGPSAAGSVRAPPPRRRTARDPGAADVGSGHGHGRIPPTPQHPFHHASGVGPVVSVSSGEREPASVAQRIGVDPHRLRARPGGPPRPARPDRHPATSTSPMANAETVAVEGSDVVDWTVSTTSAPAATGDSDESVTAIVRTPRPGPRPRRARPGRSGEIDHDQDVVGTGPGDPSDRPRPHRRRAPRPLHAASTGAPTPGGPRRTRHPRPSRTPDGDDPPAVGPFDRPPRIQVAEGPSSDAATDRPRPPPGRPRPGAGSVRPRQQPVRQIRPHRLLQATGTPRSRAGRRSRTTVAPLVPARSRCATVPNATSPGPHHDLGHPSLGGGERARGVRQPVVEEMPPVSAGSVTPHIGRDPPLTGPSRRRRRTVRQAHRPIP